MTVKECVADMGDLNIVLISDKEGNTYTVFCMELRNDDREVENYKKGHIQLK